MTDFLDQARVVATTRLVCKRAFRKAYRPDLPEETKIQLYAQFAKHICDPAALEGPPEDAAQLA